MQPVRLYCKCSLSLENLLTVPNVYFSDICTMRLDFETFTTTGPTVTNDATTATLMDSFVVKSSPSGFTAPTIAGENKGQHSNSNWFFFNNNHKL